MVFGAADGYAFAGCKDVYSACAVSIARLETDVNVSQEG